MDLKKSRYGLNRYHLETRYRETEASLDFERSTCSKLNHQQYGPNDRCQQNVISTTTIDLTADTSRWSIRCQRDSCGRRRSGGRHCDCCRESHIRCSTKRGTIRNSTGVRLELGTGSHKAVAALHITIKIGVAVNVTQTACLLRGGKGSEIREGGGAKIVVVCGFGAW